MQIGAITHVEFCEEAPYHLAVTASSRVRVKFLLLVCNRMFVCVFVCILVGLFSCMRGVMDTDKIRTVCSEVCCRLHCHGKYQCEDSHLWEFEK